MTADANQRLPLHTDIELDEFDATVAAIREALDDPRPSVSWEDIKERFARRHQQEPPR